MQVHLKRVIRRDKDKQGNPLKTKTGKPYKRVSIQTEEHGDKWLSGFSSEWNEDWNEGDVVSLTVEENGQYLNFSKSDPMDDLIARIEALEKAVFAHSALSSPDEPEINDNDVPF